MNNLRLRLLMAAFESIKDCDAEETAHILRSLADEIETSGCPELDEMQDFVVNLVDLFEEE